MPGTEGAWRLLRGVVVGATATGVAVGGHLAAGDRPPTGTTVVCLAALLGAAGVWLGGVRWTLPRLLGVLLVAQSAMHTIFVQTQPVTAAADHVHTAAAHDAVTTSGAAMVAGHVVAAVVTALLLRRGDAWLGGVLDALALRAIRLLDSFASVCADRPRPVPVRLDGRPRQHRSWAPAWSRGPPSA